TFVYYRQRFFYLKNLTYGILYLMKHKSFSEGIYLKTTTNIPHWLTKQASLHPNKVAIELVDGTCITFLQLKQKSEYFAKQLANLHIEKETRVAILSSNHIDMIIAIHAL